MATNTRSPKPQTGRKNPKVQQRNGLKARTSKADTPEQIAERRAQAFELRKAGVGYRQIAERTGVSLQVAHNDVRVVLESLTNVEDVEDMRQLELERLDRLRMGLWARATSGDLPSIETFLRVSARAAKLAGLDAPVRLAGHDGGGLFPVVPRQVVVDVLSEVLGEVGGEVGVVDAEVITDSAQ